MGSDTPRNSPVDPCQEEGTPNTREIQKTDAAMRTEVSGRVPEKPKSSMKRKEGQEKENWKRRSETKERKAKPLRLGCILCLETGAFLGPFLCREHKYAVRCFTGYLTAPA